ncbi:MULTISPECIES: hypothetical protein [Arthrobacter]|uniref:Uncharacterized protein n=1 Tax=Arthrobacter terricola TaxID=2547396 RepID=A0A4R5KB00_9MICC|nr:MULTISPECIES: hypothetical protein [Arthrobacter]MBT8162932.1 hypothetical protein [Arthrobacter sp. GN70]TDF91658.1 hypothetical protein E1809_20270 [Arthrobacter terricola]
MTSVDPRAWFPGFYANPAVQALAPASRWTISGQLGDNEDQRKAPVDIRELLDHRRLRGAWALDDRCLLTLDELTSRLPTAANCAFYLRAPLDGLIVIDIEKSCPPDISGQLLALPSIIYSEQSMSGLGYHLLTALPGNFADFPGAAGHKVLREEHGWYEILIDHWITFTRRPLDEDAVNRGRSADVTPGFSSVEAVYAALAEAARSRNTGSGAVATTVHVPDIPGSGRIVRQMIDGTRKRLKTPDDFHGDTSRWEFSVLGTLYHEMHTHLAGPAGFGCPYSRSDQAWLLYQAAVRILPERHKHHERRNGRPFLLDRAAAMIAGQSPAGGRSTTDGT